jgi:uncharacterized membrane protein
MFPVHPMPAKKNTTPRKSTALFVLEKSLHSSTITADTSTDSSARVTVSRLSRVDRDDLQKDFAENSTSHQLLKMFVV